MCTYNGARFLPEQLDSILGQTRQPDEVIICDDRSEDSTRTILDEFASRAPFIVQLVNNDSRLGSTKNFEKGIGLSNGDVIALCDQDDIWYPHKLEAAESLLHDRTEIDGVFTDADLIDESSAGIGMTLWDAIGFTRAQRDLVASGRVLEVILRKEIVTGATFSFRRRLRQLFLPIPDEWVHDAWIAFLIASVSNLATIPETTMAYRLHPGNQIGVPKTPSKKELHRRLLGSRSDFARFADKYGQVLDRLVGTAPFPDKAALLESLRDKVDHLRVRADLPRALKDRVPRVSRELSTRRYHRYSKGWRSAIKDLVVR